MEYASFVEEVPNGSPSPTNHRFSVSPIVQYIAGLFEGEVPFQLGPSGYSPTEDIYGSQRGIIEWRQGYVQMRDERLSKTAIFGVLDKELTAEVGGPLLGLVKRTNPSSQKVQLRPTFSEQGQEVGSFSIDSPGRLLTLAGGQPLIPKNAKDVIPLIDLRQYGDFVEHFACMVGLLKIGDQSISPEMIAAQGQPRRKIVAVFDSGLTGCLFTQPLWDILAQKGLELSKVSSLEVGVYTEDTQANQNLFRFQSDEGKNPLFGLSSISLDWFDDEETCPHVVVLGQTFLCEGCLTIDIDDRRSTFTS